MTSIWVSNTPAPKITSAKQVGTESVSDATSAETQSRKFKPKMPAKVDAPKGRVVGIKPEYADLMKEGLQKSIRK